MTSLANTQSSYIKRRKKIIHLIPQYGIGGVEVAAKSMLNSIEEKPDNEIDFQVATIAGSAFPNGSYTTGIGSINNPLAYIKLFLYLVSKKPDTVISSLWRSHIISIPYKIFFKNKLVIFLHSETYTHKIDLFFNKTAILLSDFILADSNATLKSQLKMRYKKKSKSISFLLYKYSPLPPVTSNKIIFWGRLNIKKRLERAIALIGSLRDNDSEFQYHIYGNDDGEAEKISNLCNKLHLDDLVTLNPAVDHTKIPVIANGAQFYLQTSEQEGASASVIEAMQLGIVPIITPVGDIKNYCIDQYNAIVLDNIDDINYSTKKIINEVHNYKYLRRNAIETWSSKNTYTEDMLAFLKELDGKNEN